MTTLNNAVNGTVKANFYKNTILENICFDGYELKTKPVTDKEKINALFTIFKSEYLHQNNERKNITFLFSEWLAGLPSSLSVPFSNYDILNNGIKAGFVLNTEKKEDIFLNNYFLKLSNSFFKLKTQLNK